MEKLFFFDETFYWGRSGKRATVIEAECELTQDVRLVFHFESGGNGAIPFALPYTAETDRLPTAIHQELAALFPGTTYADRGRHDFDSFPLGSVPRKRKL